MHPEHALWQSLQPLPMQVLFLIFGVSCLSLPVIGLEDKFVPFPVLRVNLGNFSLFFVWFLSFITLESLDPLVLDEYLGPL